MLVIKSGQTKTRLVFKILKTKKKVIIDLVKK